MSDGKNIDALFSDLPPDCVIQPCPGKSGAGLGQNASNGKASNDKGNMGVNARLAEINSIKGATVLGRNVTIVTESGVRFQADIVWRDPAGTVYFDEVKYGPSSHLTTPQRNGLHEFGAGKFTVAGARAREAGLIPGEPRGGIPAPRFGGWTLKGFGGADPEKMMEKVREAWRKGAASPSSQD